MKANEITTVLNHLKDSSYQRVLINGNWGIGKTKYVTDFKNQYSNACYVSLFGKKDIDSLIQEIYFRIIENTPQGTLKKASSVLREKLTSVNIQFAGVSLSMPVIEDLNNTLNKELEKKETFIIIFDDLERKHDNLSIKEILGLIDSLSKIENIKTVLIAAKDQMEEKDKEVFKKYQEKAIDRTYTIEEYADDAPVNILEEQVWNVISVLAENFKFNNLRTFEKTNLFIKEVVDILGEEVFTEKFTTNDLYRMCYATVFYNIEHKSEMILLDTKETKSDFRNAYYTSGESGVIEYLTNYILKNSLDNAMSKNIFHHIKKWYETGSYSREKIVNIITSINSYEEKPRNFFSSEQEILELIDHARNYIKNINGNESIEEVISRLSTSFAWCDVLSVDFGISNEEIVTNVKNNISQSIDIEKNAFQNEINLWHFHIESEEALKVVRLINEEFKIEYYNQLLQRIEKCFYEGSYHKYTYIKDLSDSIISLKEKTIRDKILKSLSENRYFFPIPSGQITEELWNWCHRINRLIKNINQDWEQEGYYGTFLAFFIDLEETKNDKMLQHRLNHLFGIIQ
ncbi:KAP family NTPase [Alkalihalobacterium elongatum]|uniref:KAP family NTPase n=1 Tax=Alkalihalobacterium elongatum TaxID=2675466 RepID=UPI001C1FDD31|nr:KAP family NTPase [Alkalihalobacterium elongatum]